MKLTFTAIALAALCDAALANPAARVFVHDPHSVDRPETQSRQLHPVAARLVLAQRAGVEDFHGLDFGKQEVIDAINEFGVQTALFAEEEDRTKRALIMVEGVADPIASMPSLKSYTGFQISPNPSSASTRGLFADLAKQLDPINFAHLPDESVLSTITEYNHFSPNMDLSHLTKSIADFEKLFLMLKKQEHWHITVLVTAPETEAKTQHESFEWGTYDMPDAQTVLSRRETSKEKPHAGLKSSSSSLDFSAPVAFASNATVVRGILPACFATEAQCVERTKNCTGHGHCKKMYHDTTSKPAIDCYSCACSPTTSGKKTTKWGGPACQKQDISVEFWLIVLFTVGMIFLIGFAIGQIWEMGNEELPSVIGAGVSGPSARK